MPDILLGPEYSPADQVCSWRDITTPCSVYFPSETRKPWRVKRNTEIKQKDKKGIDTDHEGRRVVKMQIGKPIVKRDAGPLLYQEPRKGRGRLDNKLPSYLMGCLSSSKLERFHGSALNRIHRTCQRKS